MNNKELWKNLSKTQNLNEMAELYNQSNKWDDMQKDFFRYKVIKYINSITLSQYSLLDKQYIKFYNDVCRELNFTHWIRTLYHTYLCSNLMQQEEVIIKLDELLQTLLNTDNVRNIGFCIFFIENFFKLNGIFDNYKMIVRLGIK